MEITLDNALDKVMMAAQTAAMLEVSGTPKPGNVHRTRDFWDTRFEHFLAGGVALGPAIRRIASRGALSKQDNVPMDSIQVGKGINEAISSVSNWHHGANTHLGTVLLLTPIAGAAGVLALENQLNWDVNSLQKITQKVMQHTTVDDAILVYKTLSNIGYNRHGHVDTEDAPDAFNDDAYEELRKRQLTLFDVMSASSNYDRIASEMINGFPVTFEIGVKAFQRDWDAVQDVNMATIHVFLEILSKTPDLLIARKVGLQYTDNAEDAVKIGLPLAKEISKDAERALKAGGFKSHLGKQLVRKLDSRLHSRKNLLNPGSTADLTAATLMIMILSGWRP